jgi:hypothetical protein
MNISEKFLKRVLPDFSPEVKMFLKSPWLDGSGCHIVSAHPGGKPVLFFLLYGSGSGQQTLDSAIETSRSKVIQKLAEGAGVTTVFFEGFPSGQEIKRTPYHKTAGGLSEEAIGMKAEEYAQAMSPVAITLVGIDDMTLYSESANALSEWRREYKAMENALSALDEFLMAKCEECSSELRTILQAKRSYQNGGMALKDYVKFLYAEAEGTSVSLHDMKSFKRLWKVISEESDIDFEAAEREREILMQELGPALSDPKQWIGKSLQALAPEVFRETNSADDIEAQAKLMDAYLRASPERMRAFRESQFYRTAIYGAHCKGLDGLKKSNATPEEQNKAFLIGMLYGPKAIAELVEDKQKQYFEGRLSTSDIYHFTLDLAIFTGFDETRIPNIIRYARYARRYEAVLTFDLFEQISQIEREIAKKASFSEIDTQVLDLYLLFEDLKERVELTLPPRIKAKDFSEEHSSDNKAQSIGKSPLLTRAAQGILDGIRLLDKVESIARQFYKGSVPRGRIMLENFQKEINQRHLDGAIVSVGGFHCKSMIDEIIRKSNSTSCLIILPTAGKEFPAGDLSAVMAFGGIQEKETEELFLSYPLLGDPGYETFESLPSKECGNEIHRYEAPCIWDRVVCLRSPGSRATFYCATCREFYCGLELQQVLAPPEKVQALPEDNPLRILISKMGGEPFGLKCMHCGNFVGIGDKTIIWTV